MQEVLPMKRTPLFLLICIVLFGCAAPVPVIKHTEPSAVPSIAVTDPKIDVVATALPAVVVELTTVPTSAPDPTPTPVPTLTPVPTPTPEPTPTPAPFTSMTLPSVLRPRKGYERGPKTSMLRETATGAYVIYGRFGDADPAYYPCDENGTITPGVEALTRACMLPMYTPDKAPAENDQWMLAVFLPSQSVVAFRSEDGEWIEERVMICSSGRAKHDTPTGEFAIYQRYEYKLLGTEETPCYGLWACRFRAHHLFHSVPISAEAGRDSELGHRMTNMKKYEKLGTVASDGCVRLTVRDAKWIYELTENRSVTVLVTKAVGPTPEKPPAVIWEEPYTDKNGYGWDPTDPHPDNPYHAVYGTPMP